MQRRDFILASLAAAGATLLRPLVADTPSAPRRRAAVTIGINHAGNLPALAAAQSGARDMADWLDGEGFDVRRFIDDAGPVTAKDVFDAVAGFVDRDLDQLVVYFAGHGFIRGYSEFWLLSGAPDNPNEAISVLESVQLAQECPIPSVVFISDACRSSAQSLQAERVYGSLIFPNPKRPPNQLPDVDLFYATVVGDPAWEVPSAQSVQAFAAIYTETFLTAFRTPDQPMVEPGPDGKLIVPNNRLKVFLAREVPKRAREHSIQIEQRPQTLVVSADSTYIGHVAEVQQAVAASVTARDHPRPGNRSMPAVASKAASRIGAAAPAMATPTPPAAPTAYDVARRALSGLVLARPLSDFAADEIAKTDALTGFSKKRTKIAQRRELTWAAPIRSGLLVAGTTIKATTTDEGARVQHRPGADTELAFDLAPGRRAASVAVEFADGTGTLVALLDGYCATVTVDEPGVANVSYIPTKTNPLRAAYESEADRLLQMHATIATAARFGAFMLEGGREGRAREAGQLASEIRVLKDIDPTLGLYAAYAYAQAGLPDQVRSVAGYLRDTLGVDLFDVALLAQNDWDPAAPTNATLRIPFCPLFAQGWNLLRVKRATVPAAVAGTRDTLRPALWSTYSAAGMAQLKAYLQSRA